VVSIELELWSMPLRNSLEFMKIKAPKCLCARIRTQVVSFLPFCSGFVQFTPSRGAFDDEQGKEGAREFHFPTKVTERLGLIGHWTLYLPRAFQSPTRKTWEASCGQLNKSLQFPQVSQAHRLFPLVAGSPKTDPIVPAASCRPIAPLKKRPHFVFPELRALESSASHQVAAALRHQFRLSRPASVAKRTLDHSSPSFRIIHLMT
jgi:hypothetical protein